jgi:hypothetical protein
MKGSKKTFSFYVHFIGKELFVLVQKVQAIAIL